jgi:hypothetical protein
MALHPRANCLGRVSPLATVTWAIGALTSWAALSWQAASLEEVFPGLGGFLGPLNRLDRAAPKVGQPGISAHLVRQDLKLCHMGTAQAAAATDRTGYAAPNIANHFLAFR